MYLPGIYVAYVLIRHQHRCCSMLFFSDELKLSRVSGDLCAPVINLHILVFFSFVNKVFSSSELELDSFILSMCPTQELRP